MQLLYIFLCYIWIRWLLIIGCLKVLLKCSALHPITPCTYIRNKTFFFSLFPEIIRHCLSWMICTWMRTEKVRRFQTQPMIWTMLLLRQLRIFISRWCTYFFKFWTSFFHRTKVSYPYGALKWTERREKKQHCEANSNFSR